MAGARQPSPLAGLGDGGEARVQRRVVGAAAGDGPVQVAGSNCSGGAVIAVASTCAGLSNISM